MMEIIFFILGVMLIVAGITSLRYAYKRGSALGAIGASFFFCGLLALVAGLCSIWYLLS